jgi:hypothetical protein
VTQLVVLADVCDDAVGQEYMVCIDATGPTGSRWTPARRRSCFPSNRPEATTHNVRIQGQHNQIVLPLQENIASR